jgi:hypothetical protein
MRAALCDEAFGVVWQEGRTLGFDASLEEAHRAVG